MNHGQSGVGLASLDTAHVGAEQTAPFGQVLLRHGSRQPQFADTVTKGSLGGVHRRTVGVVHSFIHTLIRTSGGADEA